MQIKKKQNYKSPNTTSSAFNSATASFLPNVLKQLVIPHFSDFYLSNIFRVIHNFLPLHREATLCWSNHINSY